MTRHRIDLPPRDPFAKYRSDVPEVNTGRLVVSRFTVGEVVVMPRSTDSNRIAVEEEPCPICHGEGSGCDDCDGTGVVPKGGGDDASVD